MFVVKVYCKIETSPWTLTLTEPVPEAFELPASDWPEKKNFWTISEEEQPGDSDVFFQEVVFFIDRHSWVVRSTGKVSRGKFQNDVNETGKNTSFNTATRNKRSSMTFYGGSVEGIVNFDTRCTTFTFYTFILIASLYSIQRQARIFK